MIGNLAAAMEKVFVVSIKANQPQFCLKPKTLVLEGYLE